MLYFLMLYSKWKLKGSSDTARQDNITKTTTHVLVQEK
jgi:hypothetical protein